jgi:hypothetical protein
MSDVGLVVLGWFLGNLSTGIAELARWWRDKQHRHKMQAVIEFFLSGTRLRNRGQRVSTELEETDWLNEWRDWSQGMARATVAVDPVRAANVSTLVNFPLLNFPGVGARMQHSLSELTETLQRLSVFISS